MGIQKLRKLSSLCIKIDPAIVEIGIDDLLIEDGNIINKSTSFGAYELIENDLPEYIQEDINANMAMFTNESLVSFMKENSLLRKKIQELTDENRILKEKSLLNNESYMQ